MMFYDINKIITGCLKFSLLLLVAVCVYDPANLWLGWKVPLFILAWVLFISKRIINREFIHIPKRMFLYLTLFIVIPLISIMGYFIAGGSAVKYDGFLYLKAYFFLTLVIILYAEKIDLLESASVIITSMAILSIALIMAAHYLPELSTTLRDGGAKYGIYYLGYRLYGLLLFSNFPISVYFHASDLMILPLGYFTMKICNTHGIARAVYGLLLMIIIAAMFFSATRSNIVVCVLVPLCIMYWHLKPKGIIACFFILWLGLCLISGFNFNNLSFLTSDNFTPVNESTARPSVIKNHIINNDNPSNQCKISFVKGYMQLFTDKKILWFGQGLGSYFHTTVRGDVSVTELTYFEFIRRFGLILSGFSFALLLYPLWWLKDNGCQSEHYLLIVYFFYLVMTFFNPFLMNSNGMLLLAIVLYKIFSSPQSEELGIRG